MIPFNKPFLTGNETHYIKEAVESGKISGNGLFTQKCQNYFEKEYGFKKALLTTSCTDALEMAAILANIQPGDEVIIPSFTFVSTALAFVRQGAKVVFTDSNKWNPNIDVELIEGLITEHTKAIIPVHYAGIACNMNKIMQLAQKYNLLVIEDAAQAICGNYKNNEGKIQKLGSIGHMAAFSFHETKNVISGEGGMLAINDNRFMERAEIIWEKGTNRSQFFRGEVNKYNWKDIGSSFLPSEITAAFLWAQLQNIDLIQLKRIKLWNIYHQNLKDLYENAIIESPHIPNFATNNGHIYYILLNDSNVRDKLIAFLKSVGIMSVFHYLPLHSSDYYASKHDGRELPMSEKYSNCLLRLPMYFDLQEHEVQMITDKIHEFFNQQF
ncbi:MAG TPA: dTDP-4-amino-4,6-dideoxygalactose transaminase [Bacteroidia bacterium]|nr:dTDP-4-amino-4,6-dideoxygalactose transaminase [Bacteroidia bacterium]